MLLALGCEAVDILLAADHLATAQRHLVLLGEHIRFVAAQQVRRQLPKLRLGLLHRVARQRFPFGDGTQHLLLFAHLSLILREPVERCGGSLAGHARIRGEALGLRLDLVDQRVDIAENRLFATLVGRLLRHRAQRIVLRTHGAASYTGRG